MWQIILRILLTLIIVAIAYFAVRKVWTSDIDLAALLKRPSEVIPVKKEPIVVSPDRISLMGKNYGVQSTLKFYNQSKEILYGVTVKLTIEDSDLKAEQVELKDEAGEGFVSMEIGNLSWNVEAIVQLGINTKQKECIYLTLFDLDPGEPVTFLLRVRQEHLSETEPKGRVDLNIIGYEKEPPRMLYKNGKAFLQMKAYDDFKVKGIRVKLKKK